MALVRGVRNDELTSGEDKDVDYEMVGTSNLLSSHANTIPMPSAVQGPRIFYGSRQAEQALPMVQREAPFVRNLNENNGRSWDYTLGNYSGVFRAKAPGTVKKVTPDEIHLQHDDGTTSVVDLYNNLPFNRKSSITNFAKVKDGDRVEPDQLLATSNFTDDEGRLALGRNLRVAVVPFKGATMDDAVVISASAARKLTTDHAETVEVLPEEGWKGGKGHYTSLFAKKFKDTQLANLGDDGVVKPGSIIQPGDPVALFTKPRTFSSEDATDVSRLSRTQRFVRKDAAQVWEGAHEALVTDVARAKDGTVKVLVKYEAPVQPADKLSARAGQKFTVSRIIPDEHMLRDASGRPMDLLFNQLGLPSRENASTFYEIMLGKIAEKRGKAYTLPNFNKPGESWVDMVEKELKDNQVEPAERVFDPEENRWLDNPVTTGSAYILRLHHLAGNKLSARGQGSYDCFDDKTEVLTDRGWVPWPEVNSADLLCTPEEDMETAVFERPSRLVSYDYDGWLMGYESPYLNWAVTPNHEFLTYGKNGKPSRLTADALSKRVRVAIPQFGFTCKGEHPTHKVIPSTSSGTHSRNREDLVLSFEDYASFMGWWVAEGSVVESNGRVYIWQDAAVNSDHSQEIYGLMVRIFGREPLSHKAKGKQVGWRITDRRVSEYLLKESGFNSHTKRIPRDIILSGDSAVDAFMAAYVKGDGYDGDYVKHDGRVSRNIVRRVGSVSRLLMDDMQEMLMRRGKGLIAKCTMQEGRSIKFADRETFGSSAFFSGSVHLVRKRATVVPAAGMPRYTGTWTALPYVGKVYCATTRTGLLVVRRDGKPCVTGNSNMQPQRGGGKGGGAQRMSGLEMAVLQSSGARGVQKESVLLRGELREDYWRALRANRPLPKLGKPFVWDKFQALLNGVGVNARDLGKGKLRLTPFTEKDLSHHKSVEIANDGIIDLKTMEPKPGGLFDPQLVREGKWGHITLPFPVINPAYEPTVKTLLGLTEKEYQELLHRKKETHNGQSEQEPGARDT